MSEWKEHDGGQAFPSHPALYSSADQGRAQGMSLRAYIATAALAGLGTWAPALNDMSYPLNSAESRQARAEWAVAQADALLAALKGE